MSADPDILRDTDDDGCPWCPYDHVATGPCPEGEWLDEDGEVLADDGLLVELAGALADVRPAPPRRPRPTFCGHLTCRAARTGVRALLLGAFVLSSYLTGWLIVLTFRAIRAMLGVLT